MLPPPPQQPLILLLPCSKHQEIFDRNTNTKACKCSIRHYRSTSTNFWFGCEGWKVQTQREAPLEEMQLWIFCRKTSFSNLDFSFSLIKLYHSGAKRCISANKWIFGKFPFSSHLCHLLFLLACRFTSILHQHEFQMLEHMNDQTFALCIQLNVQQHYLFVFRKEQLGNWTKTKWVSFCWPFFNSWSPVNKYLSFVTDLHQRISSIILFETDLWQHSVWVKILMLWCATMSKKFPSRKLAGGEREKYDASSRSWAPSSSSPYFRNSRWAHKYEKYAAILSKMLFWI